MVDDLRGLLDDDDNDGDFTFEEAFNIAQDADSTSQVPQGDGRILGLGAGERAFLSFILFLIVVIFGVLLLIATDRLVF